MNTSRRFLLLCFGLAFSAIAAFAQLPTINQQPNGNGAPTGQTMTFNVLASGATSYQWFQKDPNTLVNTQLTDGTLSAPAALAGEVVSGATTANLTISSLPAGANGDIITVKVSNGSGSVTSNGSASMTVFDEAVFIDTDIFSDKTVAAGDPPVSFTFSCGGGPLPTFQWFKDASVTPLVAGVQTSGSTISFTYVFDAIGQDTTSTLTITNPLAGDAGRYHAVATNTLTDLSVHTATSSATFGNLTVTLLSQSAPVINSATTTTVGAAYTATVSGSGFGALSWALGTGSTAAGAAINSSTGVVSYTGVGLVKIKAQYLGDGGHSASPFSADFTVTVNKGTQATLSVNSSASGIFGTPYTATSTGGSGTGAITWALGTGSTAPTAAINSSTGAVTSTGAGTVVINATKATDANYLVATSANFTVTLAKAAQAAVTVNSSASGTFGTPYTATATGGSGTGAITWALGTGSTAPTPAINSSTGAVTSTGAGTVVINATKATDANYLVATSANFTVTLAKAAQATLAVNSSASGTYGMAYLGTTTGGSGTGALSWALGTGSTAPGAAVNPTTGAVSSTGAGTVVINATKAADANYLVATSANFTITLGKAPLTVTADDKARPVNTANPAFTVSYSGFVSPDNASSLTTQPTATSTATTGSPAGTYAITPSGGVSSNYAFTYVNGTLTVLHVTANDFNGDGKADVLWSNTTSGDRYLWLMNGGVITTNVFLGTIPAQWTATTGDFNGDGKCDILWSNTSNGDRYIWLMNGGSVASSIFLGTVAPQWTPTVADFNGDGKADIFWSNTVSGDRYFWLMNGGSVTSSIFLGTVAPVWTPTAADFNGDGKADILWSNTSSGDRYFWLMNGGSVASSIFLGTVAPQWTPVVGDFSGDGKADILWSNTVSGDRYIWLMNGGSVASSIFLGNIAPVWTAVTGDLNGDGKADLIWSNTSSGDRYFWLMNGGSVAGSIFLGNIPPDWIISH